LGKWKLRLEKVSWKEEAKKQVALEAVKHVEDGFVVGLGSGSTAAYVIQELGRLMRQDGLRVLGVPSSSQALLLAVHSGLPLTTLDEHPVLDLAIDGADEVDKRLDMIKGGGGALTREKIVASAAKQVVIVADETKLGGKPFLREAKVKVGAVVTDNGNYIVDVDFGPIDNAEELNQRLKIIPGIIETGLFIGLADIVYLGKKDRIIRLEK
jgi:ribose 5-phosphate isomerase A